MKKILGWLDSFRHKLGKWVWVIIAVLVIIVWKAVASSNSSVKVETATVSRADLVQTVSTSGTIDADQYSQLTFPTGGLIERVYVKAGESVKKGAWIASLDTIPLNAIYEDALNTYRSTQAAVDLEHDNDKSYGAGETFAQRSTRTTAEVANDNAYNNVLAAEDNLKNANLIAPFDGVIDTVNPSSPGIQVLPGAANYTIVNPSTVYFDAEVEETDLSNVKVGQDVNITLDAYPDQTFQGMVTTIGLVAFTSSTGGNAYHVRISLPDNSDEKFRVGMGGDVDIIYNTVSQALQVPASAVSTDSTNYVWTVIDGRAKRVDVGIGASNADETEITSGLSEGQVVITQPPTNIQEGTRVSI